jgi:hypothetical protein
VKIIPENIKEFWSKVNKADNCWIFTGGNSGKKGKDSYGLFSYNKERVYAHRLSFAINKNWPNTEYVIHLILHSCNNPVCVNPSHLREGTYTHNLHDRYKIQREREATIIAKMRLDAWRKKNKVILKNVSVNI